jgi:hypothetical protein
MKNFLKPAPEFRNGYKDPKRLAKIHDLKCCACEKLGIDQQHPTEAHHLIGFGIGKKASDLFTIPLCSKHHARGNKGDAIHETPLKQWERKFGTQQELLEKVNLELINKMLEKI